MVRRRIASSASVVGVVNCDVSQSIRRGGTLGLGTGQWCRGGRNINATAIAKAQTAAIARIQSVTAARGVNSKSESARRQI
jgi:hypothetical protein